MLCMWSPNNLNLSSGLSARSRFLKISLDPSRLSGYCSFNATSLSFSVYVLMCFPDVFLLAWLARCRSSFVLEFPFSVLVSVCFSDALLSGWYVPSSLSEFPFSFSVSRGLSVVSFVPNVCLAFPGSSSVSFSFWSSSFYVVICVSCSSSSASCIFFMFFDLAVSFCFPELCVSLFVSPVLLALL